MTDQDHYPFVPWARRGSPQTAFAAAVAIREKVIPIRDQTLKVVANSARHGATGHEVAAALCLHVTQVRSRLSELLAAGKIVDSGRVRKGGCGVDVTVWVIPEYGPPKPDEPQGDLLAGA